MILCGMFQPCHLHDQQSAYKQVFIDCLFVLKANTCNVSNKQRRDSLKINKTKNDLGKMTLSFSSIITLAFTRSSPIQPRCIHSHQIRHDAVFKPPQTLPPSCIARFKASALLADVINSTRNSASKPPRFVRAGLTAVITEHLAASSAMAFRCDQREPLLAAHAPLYQLVR